MRLVAALPGGWMLPVGGRRYATTVPDAGLHVWLFVAHQYPRGADVVCTALVIGMEGK
jgi:hypothetical protein